MAGNDMDTHFIFRYRTIELLTVHLSITGEIFRCLFRCCFQLTYRIQASSVFGGMFVVLSLVLQGKRVKEKI